ncbi:Ragulator complex LAMTOR3 [Brachionus plicatilis]|uniref:Ragulator complex LAMTOR3 n=1 Tax=Brachionus plicatilis TaxID=10195 RepID=A0A3M7QY65_BRAPC|nr:Ragulator complex LAMTOR3 [Brachionus plicatilis]
MEFLNPEKTLGLFNNFKYNILKKNENGTIRWRCESCKSMSVTTDLDGVLTRTVDANNSHKNGKCKRLCQISIECNRQYETLKFESGNVNSFSFSHRYRELLQPLQAKFDPKIVSEFFPSESRARAACDKIRAKNKIKEPKSTSELQITDDIKFQTINQEKELFLRYDNQSVNGNRILIFMSNTAIEILRKAEEYHFDGTFKTAPGIFYQLLSLHAIVDNMSYPCVFILLENKNTKTYVIAIEQIHFEVSLMKAVVSVFPDVQLKGCWFHFTQAIRKRIFLNGFKSNFLLNSDFKFWVKRFMALALIPIENIEEAFDIILTEIPIADEKILAFIRYFKDQWLNGTFTRNLESF